MGDIRNEGVKGGNSLDTLSLSGMPLSSSTLKNARLIKNARMETTVELYNDPIAGSFQITPEDVAEQISASERDQEIINKLARLDSYDVYSLRIGLKKLGIETTDPALLELSEETKDGLAAISVQFTRPLVERIFGAGNMAADDPEALHRIFRDADVSKVRQNLKTMSEKTGIAMGDLPAFLEEYSEVFLAVAYYRHSFESVGTDADRFLSWLKELRAHRDVMGSPQTTQACRRVEDAMRYLVGSVRERLSRFQAGFDLFWTDINRESFQALQRKIEENHASMGPVLCGLNVKLRNWSREFPDNNMGGPQKRAKYVITELEPGIERLRLTESEARKAIGMASGK